MHYFGKKYTSRYLNMHYRYIPKLLRRDFFYTLFSALEFWKIFRGLRGCEIFFIFSLFDCWAVKCRYVTCQCQCAVPWHVQWHCQHDQSLTVTLTMLTVTQSSECPSSCHCPGLVILRFQSLNLFHTFSLYMKWMDVSLYIKTLLLY
jgi:hypothetical protein